MPGILCPRAFVCRSPGTIYAEQRKLGPAQYLLWQNGESKVARYWQTSFQPDRQRRPEQLGEELVAQVRRAVRASVSAAGAGTTGAFLSGGLDSRSEEHTSELQSLMRISYAVFCLKKKNKKQTYSKNTS